MASSWTIGRKLTVGFVIVGCIAGLLGGVGYYGVNDGRHAVDDIGRVRLPGVSSLLTLAGHAQEIRAALYALGTTGLPPGERAEHYESVKHAGEVCESERESYGGLPHSSEEAAVSERFKQDFEAWRGETVKYLDSCRAFDRAAISDPEAVARAAERFTGDHFKLAERVLRILDTKETFAGGDDPTACAYGKWSAAFKTDNPELAKNISGIDAPHRRFHAAVKQIKELAAAGNAAEAKGVYGSEASPAAEAVRAGFVAIQAEADRALQLLVSARKLMTEQVTPKATAAFEVLDQLVEINQRTAAEGIAGNRRTASLLTTVSLAAAIGGFVLAIGLGLLMSSGINRQLGRIAAQLSEGADQVGDASMQVAGSSQTLAAGASEQASSLEETSSALEEMSAMTRSSADKARQASEFAATARSEAVNGEQTVGQMVGAMNAINESAHQIGAITKVIEEIAFQTNLLALNAAVEAARAGEQGKGFAVVAEEVRNLAQRASQSARQTAELIEGAVGRAKEGAGVAQNAAVSLHSIVGGVAQVAQLLGEISTASREQAEGVAQINSAVTQMDSVTQSNAAGAEESASAAEELSAQSQQVKGIVDDLMRLVGGGSHGRSTPILRPDTKREAAPAAPARGNVPRKFNRPDAGARETEQLAGF